MRYIRNYFRFLAAIQLLPALESGEETLVGVVGRNAPRRTRLDVIPQLRLRTRRYRSENVDVGRRERAVGTLVVVDGQADLPQVVHALGAGGGLAHLLDGGQEQADEDGDDGDHHQQLDQRERGSKDSF